MKRTRLLLADDHPLFLDGLQKILEPEFEVAGIVQDGRSLVSEERRLKPDVILADISMPLLNGLEAARQIKKNNDRVKIIFLTMHSDPTYVAEGLQAGASGYLVKNSAAGEVLNAIRAVLRGKIFVSPDIAEHALASLRKNSRPNGERVHELTGRQREVLQLVAEGRSAKEIAVILNVSHRTVEFHKQRIMEGLGLHTTAELTRFAIRHRVVAP